MELTLKRKNIDLPSDVIERLTVLASKSGESLKSYMERILTSKARENSPSPSGDSWFDDDKNLQEVMKGIQEIDRGEGSIYTASELHDFLGV